MAYRRVFAQSSHFPHRQSGVGMLEVLVTLLVLAVGLLGVAALHLAALKENQANNQRLLATVLADDIAGRMQSDRNNLSSYLFASDSSSNTPPISIWLARASTLPGGQVSVSRSAVNTSLYLVQVVWGADVADKQECYLSDQVAVSDKDINCYQVTVRE